MSVLITTPFSMLEETAAAYGMPLEEARKIEKMALDMLARDAKRKARTRERHVKELHHGSGLERRRDALEAV